MSPLEGEIASPLERWIAWYEQLPPELRRTLGVHLAVLGRGTVLSCDERPLEQGADELPLRLRSVACDAFAEAGLSVAVSALTDFIVRRRTEPSSWREEAAHQNDVIARAEAQGNDELAERLRHQIDRLPFLSRQWMRAGKTWAILRGSFLHDETVARWLGDALAPVVAHEV